MNYSVYRIILLGEAIETNNHNSVLKRGKLGKME